MINNIIMFHHHYTPVPTALVMNNQHTRTVEAAQCGGACGELLFWVIVVILIGFVTVIVIDLWKN